ncbi:hypothetical protein CR194_04965 [Salipaludibacillus keqinensis]|uniref:Uncharacterized protein n=1 Tax=Salipaludibacillus keqinensis TaxID=2045207 RepID=A0A323TJF6_9BACI|nr:hypothetical protein [Salipaludibacillus keqinensis]PYZ94879.1 hypothetical protein CR194_04965 [Salipaludibacillus keqinensis]
MQGDFINITLFFVGTLMVVLITIKIIARVNSYNRTLKQDRLEKTIRGENNNESHEEVNALTDIPSELPWEVKGIDSFEIKKYERQQLVPLNRNIKDNINNLVKLTPSAADIVKTDKKVIIKFSKEIVEKMKSGELTLMKTKGATNELRALAVDHKNKIRGHGSITVKNMKKLNPAQLANVALGVMTIISAQEHLEKINQRLNVIDNKVKTLLRYNRNDKLGRIQGAVRYLKTILPELQKEDITINHAYFAKMEDIYLVCYQELQSIFIEQPTIINNIKNVKEVLKYDLDSVVTEIETIATTFEKDLSLCFGNIELMVICLNMRTYIEGTDEVNLIRLDDIENDYKKTINHLDEFNRITKEKQMKLDGKFRFESAVTERKAKLEEKITYLNKKITKNIIDMDEQLIQLKQRKNADLKAPIDLQVEYDETGEITALYKLNKAN